MLLLLQLLFPFSDLLLVALFRERFAAHGTAQEDAVPSGHLPTQQAFPRKMNVWITNTIDLMGFLITCIAEGSLTFDAALLRD